MKTDITINATSSVDGKKVTNKISYVNPDITNSQAMALAQAFNDLTTDSYNSTTRTDTTNCEEQASKPAFLTNISMGIWSTTENKKNWINIINRTDTIEVPFLSANNQALTVQLKSSSIELSKNFPGLPKLTFSNANWSMSSTSQSMTGTNDNAFLCNFRYATQQEETFTMTVTVPGNNNYAEFNKTYTIHFYNSEV